MDKSQRLLDLYLPPSEGFILESFLATTYQIDFGFFEEELLAMALGVRSPISRLLAFRAELERRLQDADVTALYDPRGCARVARSSPRIDRIPILEGKLHSKISLLMWVRHDRHRGACDRLMRLIVGSANLTRKGFRENYECVAALDYGGRHRSPRTLLTAAIEAIRQISAESTSPQLQQQIRAFQQQCDALPEESPSRDTPSDLAVASDVLPKLRMRWAELSDAAPEKLTIVSPFWPEGATAAKALEEVIARLQCPPTIELLCRGAESATANGWVPEFDAGIAMELKGRIESRLLLRAALPNVVPDAGAKNAGVSDQDSGDETEEGEICKRHLAARCDHEQIQRPLHAKMIILQGRAGGVLYAGSSNCTRRGLGLGGPANWESGFIYQLTRKQCLQLEPILAFAGPPIEVFPGKLPKTEKPIREEETVIPRFLSEVVAEGAKVTVRFRQGEPIPSDLIILMEVPSVVGDGAWWVLYRSSSESDPPAEIVAKLATCPRCDKDLAELPVSETAGPIIPNDSAEVHWEGKRAEFPVRFDEKATLPLLMTARIPTEGELIDYFLWGCQPEDDSAEGKEVGDSSLDPEPGSPVDTRRILAYFIRRFVQAIPGIEAELQRAAYSRTALNAALLGPTSPLQLAERAFDGLSRAATPDEPEKTPIAVGFQLTEILAALLRSRAKLEDDALRNCFTPALARCRELLGQLEIAHPELCVGPFRAYRDRFAGGTP
jgi:hypothetical protein